MAKYHGIIGYVETVETSPGVWTELTTEKKHYGDVLNKHTQYDSSESVNSNFNIRNDLSIVADTYAKEHFRNMRYATFMGTKWNIKNVDVKYPRLILTLGGVYNG